METDLTQLSPAALNAWLGECERQADHSISGRTIAALIRLARSLLNFKTYVHRRLDEAGVPTDPESPHKAQGCRIGGRLDVVLGERAALAARVAELEGALLGMQQKCEGEYPKYHNDGAVPAWESMTMDIKHALDGGKETKQ